MEQFLTLDRLRPGERARVLALHGGEPLRRRLRELGLSEGAALRCLGRSPLGDPTAYSLGGVILALRRRDSAGVVIVRWEA